MKLANQEVTFLDSMGSDLSIVNAARVSMHKKSDWCVDDTGLELFLDKKDKSLLCYLARHKHWTPFAHAFLSFRIKAPIFVARQLVKHQIGLVWNEVSRRYVDDEPEFYLPKQWRARADNVKQGSSDVTISIQKTGHNGFNVGPEECIEFALVTYNSLLRQGVCPEQARMVLPQNMMTEWVWSGSVSAFSRVCSLRLDPHTQRETQEIAGRIDGFCRAYFPAAWDALKKNEHTR